jgi:glycolate oxidase iron-sulfur subunit
MHPFSAVLRAVPKIGPRLAAVVELAPAKPARVEPVSKPVRGARRVAILQGCAQPVLRPSYNAAAERLLGRLGVEVVAVKGEGCCGALVHHLGREDEALAFVKNNVDLWFAEIERGLEAIIVTASGCGTTVKDYGFMLRNDPAYAAKAAKVSSIAKDITEYLVSLGAFAAINETGIRVAYHSACSMQHGQQIREEPKMLLKQAGFEVCDIPESHICCGSAGTYNLLQPEIATQLRDRKIANIEKVSPQVIATGNVGCAVQIGSASQTPVLHTIELLDWAAGGPKPPALAHIAPRVKAKTRTPVPVD